MDRIEAIKIFLTALDEGSLSGAARKLGRSPAAVSRAIMLLEERIGTRLLLRTTRGIKLSEAGDRYATSCRRILHDLEEAALIIAGERAAPRGTLTLTASVPSGETIFRPIIGAFLDAVPTVQANLLLIDRPTNLVEEGIDVALRIGHLQDSTLVAIKVGEVRRVIVASPEYLLNNDAITSPEELAKYHIISMSHFGNNSWRFPRITKYSVPRTIVFSPRLIVNTIAAAVAAAVDGQGITIALSYQVADQLRDGSLKRILEAHEPAPLPVHLITPKGRLGLPKVRAFFDFAVPRLRDRFGQLTVPSSRINEMISLNYSVPPDFRS